MQASKTTRIIILALTAFLILFIYELPFSLKIFDKVDVLSEEISKIEKEIKKTSYYDFKIKERDFWSEVKGSEIERLDDNINNEGLVEIITETASKEEAESCELDIEGFALSEEEMEFLEDLREQKRLEQERLERERKIHLPAKILVVGDSMMMENLGSVLEKEVEKIDGIEVIKSAKYSTGLNRRDYYDWHTTTVNLIKKHRPQAIVAMFGANDGQPIVPIGSSTRYNYGTKKWEEIYRKRVNSYFTMITPNVKRVYFIGQPNSTDPQFAEKFETMNRIFEEEASKFDKVEIVKTWDRFTENGKAASILADNSGKRQYVKFGDGVHLTDHGSKIVSQLLIKQLNRGILWEEK